jgi:tRNA pseudouridine38-40 synthase
MRIIRATLAYDGTDFVGWQIQASGRSVQGVVQEGLALMHGHPVRVVAAGRTDSGVHATGQVVSFLSDLDSIPGPRFRDAMNAYLPPDARVLESAEASPGFHARRSATLRLYRYYTVNAPVLLPHLRRHRHWVRRTLDLERLRAMAGVVRGEHDFTSFTAEGDANGSRVRTVAESRFDAEGDTVVYTIAAGSFLWKMVRNIVGTALWLEENGGGAAEIDAILGARSRAAAGPTAPAHGLFLEKVRYDEALGS